MSYKLKFHKKALKEWEKLDNFIKKQFKSKLKERLENPKVEKDRLKSLENLYKIKLKKVGYRLSYQVKDDEIVVLVLKIGKRDDIYQKLNSMTKG